MTMDFDAERGMDEDPKEEIIAVKGPFVEIGETFHHHDGSNDYNRSWTDFDEVRDSGDQKVEVVGGDDWMEVAPGIESRGGWHSRRLRIHRNACPVRVKWTSFYEYVSWTDYEHNHSGFRDYWVRYEAGE
jgi:hypothetical protein